MSKKDYIKFAKMFKDELEFMQDGMRNKNMQPEEMIYYFARQTAYIFAEDNPNFDIQRYLKACGINE